MTFSVLCLSRSGIEAVLVSADTGQIQSSDNHPLEQVDPASPKLESLLPAFEAHAKKHTGLEDAVFVHSTQLSAPEKYDVLAKIKSAGVATRVTAVSYIDAYLGALQSQGLSADATLLFIETTAATTCAQFFKIHQEGDKRTGVPLYVEATNSSAPLEDFILRVSKWTEAHQPPSQIILFDAVSDAIKNTIQSRFQASSSIISATGPDIAAYAAAYVFNNLQQILEDDDDMGTYVAPAPISVALADGTASTIIHRSEVLPAGRSLIFTTAEDNQTHVVAEIVLGNHTTRPEDKFVIARVHLDGLQLKPRGEAIITVSVTVSEGWGNFIRVFEGTERNQGTPETVVQIPDPYQTPSYAAVKPFSFSPANEVTLGRLPAS